MEAICDTRVDARRIVAVATLGHVVGSTGVVIAPFTQFPQLLGVLLALLHDGSFNTRRKVVEALGVIGALDPHAHKQNQVRMRIGMLTTSGNRCSCHVFIVYFSSFLPSLLKLCVFALWEQVVEALVSCQHLEGRPRLAGTTIPIADS